MSFFGVRRRVHRRRGAPTVGAYRFSHGTGAA
jgi:hypothetical protein